MKHNKFSFTPTKKSILTLCLICFGVLASGGTMYALQAGRISDLSQQIGAKQKQVDDGRNIGQRLTALQEKLRLEQAQLSFLEKGVSEREFVPTLLKQMEKLAGDMGLYVLGVRPQKPKPKAQPGAAGPRGAEGDQKDKDKAATDPGHGELAKGVRKEADDAKGPYDKLFLAMDCQGSFANFLRYLAALEKFPKIVGVTDISLQPVNNNVGGELKISLGIVAFIQKQEKPALVGGSKPNETKP